MNGYARLGFDGYWSFDVQVFKDLPIYKALAKQDFARLGLYCGTTSFVSIYGNDLDEPEYA